MSNTRKRKNLKKSSTSKNEKNNKHPVVRLGDGQNRREKKETQSKYKIKRTEKLFKNSRNKHKRIKKSYSGKGTARTVEGRPQREVQSKADRRFCISLKKDKTDSFKNKSKTKKDVQSSEIKASLCVSKKLHDSEKVLGPPDNTGSKNKEMVFVSLDVLEDSNTYKTKFRSIDHSELKNLQNKLKTISSYHKRYLETKLETRNHIKGQEGSRNGNTMKYYKSRVKIKPKTEIKKISQKKKVLSQDQIQYSRDKKVVQEARNQETESEAKLLQAFVESYIDLWPDYSDKFPQEENIAKVDEKYIKSLLCITTKENIKEEKNDAKEADESKNRGKRKEGKKLKNKYEIPEKPAEIVRETRNLIKNTYLDMDKNSTRMVRYLTKSEMQFKLNKSAAANEKEKVEMKSEKKITSSKTETDSKRRKTRNNAMKQQDTDYIEIPFPCEVLKTEDVKELWRSVNQKESEDSLSSHSSCTVAVNHEIYGNKNLGMESYNTLKKIVEEEVHRISKYVHENKKTEEEKPSTPRGHKSKRNESHEIQEEPATKTICEVKMPSSDNFSQFFDIESGELDPVVKRRIMEAKKYQKYSSQNKQPTSDTSYFSKKDQIQEKQINGKLPSQIVKNWSVLHRLEKAFVALGTPTFPDKNLKEPRASLSARRPATHDKNACSAERFDGGKIRKTGCGASAGEKTQKHASDLIRNKNAGSIGGCDPKMKKAENIRDPTPTADKNAVPSVNRERGTEEASQSKKNPQINPIRTKIRPVSTHGKNSRKETGKESSVKMDILYFNRAKTPGDDSNDFKPKRGKLQSFKATNAEKSAQKIPEKSTLKSDGGNSDESKWQARQPKTRCDYIKKDTASPKNSFEVGKFGKRKSSEGLACNSTTKNQKEDNLERKETFEIIPKKDSHIEQVQASKSYSKIKSSDNSFSSAKNNTIHEGKSLGSWKNFQNDKIQTQVSNETRITNGNNQTVRTPTIKRRPKSQLSEKPIEEKKMKSGTDKDREMGAPGNKLKPQPVEDTSKQILLTKKQEKKSGKVRSIKERSILSISRNPCGPQTPPKNRTRVESKVASVLESTARDFILQKNDKEIEAGLQKSGEHKKPKASESNTSCLSTKTYDIELINDIVNPNLLTTDIDEKMPVNDEASSNAKISDFPVLSVISSSITDQLESIEVIRNSEELLENQQLWEKDLRHYREIVQDILNQYNRIGGLLTQSENLKTSQQDFQSGEWNGDKELNPQYGSIREYREKVISEYKALPVLEYKSKIEERKKETLKSEESTNKRNLGVVTAVSTEMDTDIKDYPLKVHKILDSRFYLDPKDSLKKIESPMGEKEKASSFLTMTRCKSSNLQQEECRLPEAFPAPRALLSDCSCLQSRIPKKDLRNELDDKISTRTTDFSKSDFYRSDEVCRLVVLPQNSCSEGNL